MSARQLVLLAALGGLGYALWRMSEGENVVSAPAGSSPPTGNAFLDILARIESGGRAYVKASSSSASGLYQFTKSTWQALGGQWGSDPTKAFGGLTPSVAEQTAMADKLTMQNAVRLRHAGIDATSAALYAAHFLGPTAAISVLLAPMGQPISYHVSAATLAANPFLKNMTIADFRAWLKRKVG